MLLLVIHISAETLEGAGGKGGSRRGGIQDEVTYAASIFQVPEKAQLTATISPPGLRHPA